MVLCALLAGLFWLTAESSQSPAPSNGQVAEQLAHAMPADAWLPNVIRVQFGPQQELPVFQRLPSLVAQKNNWSLTDSFAPLNAFGQAWAHGCVADQRRLLLFPFHDFG